MYITVGAGTSLTGVQSFLAEHGQQIPLASPWPGTTVGGLAATNMNAPLRMSYGAIRDLVLCATVVLADGRIIRAGRPVIKNVAGFDLVKLFVGSYGTLGLLADITLKVSARPRQRRSLIIPVDDLRHGLMWARRLYPISLAASAIVLGRSDSVLRFTRNMQDSDEGSDSRNLQGNQDILKNHPYVLMYTAEGLAEDVQAELRQVREVMRVTEAAGVEAKEPVEIDDISGTDVWAHFLGRAGDAVQVRVGVPVRDLPVYVQDQSALLTSEDFLVDFASGFVYCLLTMQGDGDLPRTIERLRAPALQVGGYAIVMHEPAGWRGRQDRWGYKPDTLDLMRGLKARWDPARILGAGSFVV